MHIAAVPVGGTVTHATAVEQPQWFGDNRRLENGLYINGFADTGLGAFDTLLVAFLGDVG